MPKKSKKNGGTVHMGPIFRRALAALKGRSPETVDPHEFAKELGLKHTTARYVLKSIASDKRGRRSQKAAPSPQGLPKVIEVEGEITVTSRGYMRFSRPERNDDAQVYAENEGGALHGDTVMARLVPRRVNERVFFTAEVTKIIKRYTGPVLGNVVITDKGELMLLPISKQHPPLRIIEGDVKPGDYAQAHITQYPRDGSEPGCQISRVIGRGPIAELRSIAMDYGLEDIFSPEALAAAEALPDEVLPEDLVGRADFRAQPAFTIDGADAQDFDDAVYVQREGDEYRLFVHIADVSHYVRPGTALEHTAYDRATSTYLPGLTIPMLPEKISNWLCSLRPDVDRLCLSAELCYNRQGVCLSAEIHTSVIRSCARMTYDRVNELLRGEPASEAEIAVKQQLEDMLALSKALRARRASRGSLELDAPETHIILDDEGNVTDLRRRGRGEAERIIEDFMIAANEAVARELKRLKLPCLYRVHLQPEQLRMQELARTLAALHFRLEIDAEGNVPRKALEAVIEEASDELRPIVSRFVLRSLKRAEYLPQPLGHYGLAADDYCHFTAPIRRYPDLFVHRVLKERDSAERERAMAFMQRQAPDAARQSSSMERVAQEAEWDAAALRCAQYMHGHVGETYTGIIKSFTRAAIYLMLDNTAEAVLPIYTLSDDHYEYLEDRLVVVGRKKKKTYRLGQRLDIIIDSVDMPTRRVCAKLPEQERK